MFHFLHNRSDEILGLNQAGLGIYYVDCIDTNNTHGLVYVDSMNFKCWVGESESMAPGLFFG